MDAIWSNTDFPYMCLKDVRRTSAFRSAIRQAVRPGDTVLDVGAGTGILSLFAIEAGASRVYAAEIDPLLCESLRKTACANGVADRLTVLEGDAREVAIPQPVDVVVAEMMDTGLIDELQVPVLNELRRKSVIRNEPRIVPARYRTYIELVFAQNSYFGFTILAPKHEWPFYATSEEWHPTDIRAVTRRTLIAEHDFQGGVVQETVDVTLDFPLLETREGATINAVRLQGEAVFSDGIVLPASNSLNGDKILSIPEVKVESSSIVGTIRYVLGGGLHHFELILE